MGNKKAVRSPNTQKQHDERRAKQKQLARSRYNQKQKRQQQVDNLIPSSSQAPFTQYTGLQPPPLISPPPPPATRHTSYYSYRTSDTVPESSSPALTSLSPFPQSLSSPQPLSRSSPLSLTRRLSQQRLQSLSPIPSIASQDSSSTGYLPIRQSNRYAVLSEWYDIDDNNDDNDDNDKLK